MLSRAEVVLLSGQWDKNFEKKSSVTGEPPALPVDPPEEQNNAQDVEGEEQPTAQEGPSDDFNNPAGE